MNDLAEFWPANARLDQLEPESDWGTWLILSGRGWGKTRTGAEWARAQALAGIGPGALVGPTAADVRSVMIEGPAGILTISPEEDRPIYEPSKKKLTWPNGIVALIFSAEEPDSLRGPQHAWGWVDELAAHKAPQDVWDMFSFGLRLGSHPRAVVTTTPRPLPIIRSLLAAPDTVPTRGKTRDNFANLAKSFVSKIEKRYAGTRLGRQELDGELLDDVPGALWTRAMCDEAKFEGRVPDLTRIVVAIDPSGTKGDSDDGDSIGIVVAGLGVDGFGYVLADRTCKLSPDGWGRRAVEAYHEFEADRIVAETNFGGALVENTIRTVDKSVAYSEVKASRGKAVRAEPVAALYEQSRVRHVVDPEDRDGLNLLEDQLCSMTRSGFVGDGSPDRLDALVWAITELMLGDGFDLLTFIQANS